MREFKPLLFVFPSSDRCGILSLEQACYRSLSPVARLYWCWTEKPQSRLHERV